jgi:N-methylhydantoinase B
MRNLVATQADTVAPGDIFIFNDPYLAAGQHLPDIYIVRPIFIGGRIEGWATTVAHQNDIGGIVPGSNSIGSTEIFQEGLRLPLLKLVDAGRENTAIWDILAANVRVPDKVIGDVKAQVAACLVGEREFAKLFARWEPARFRAACVEIHDYAERLTRAEIADIPDGVYRFENHIDGLGDDPRPIPFRVALTVRADEITVDWTGTSPEVRAGINAPMPFTHAASYAAIRSVLSPDIPNAQGFTRPIRVIAPAGSIVNPRPPAACGARGITGFRMMDCVMGALAQALPGRVPADGSGGSTLPTIGGRQDGKPFIFVETIMGAWGGSPAQDGQDAVAHLGANQSNVPVETIEADYPLRVESYGFVADSGGPGRHRGGMAIERVFRLLADEATLTVRSDKRRFPPFGLAGGRPGSGSLNVVNPGTASERVLPVLITEPVPLRRGDVFRHVLASGGGWGDPRSRDPELVLEDVRLGRVTPEGARRDYAVAIASGAGGLSIDAAVTAALRASAGAAS